MKITRYLSLNLPCRYGPISRQMLGYFAKIQHGCRWKIVTMDLKSPPQRMKETLFTVGSEIQKQIIMNGGRYLHKTTWWLFQFVTPASCTRQWNEMGWGWGGSDSEFGEKIDHKNSFVICAFYIKYKYCPRNIEFWTNAPFWNVYFFL